MPLTSTTAGDVAAARGFSSHTKKSFQNNPSLSQPLEGQTDMRSNGLNGRTNITGRRNNNYADAKNARGDWLAAELAQLPVAEVVAITGMTETAVHNIRRGKCKINHDNLCALLEARPDFRARFFCSVGGELLVRPDQIVALERAINSVMRGES
jgi:hypothetical protein